ncbi:MAG: hypothetical protein ACFB9N_11225 [Geitlerinemataceae cyanobacterium]
MERVRERRARDLYDRARQAWEAQDTRLVLRLCKEAAKLDPSFTAPYELISKAQEEGQPASSNAFSHPESAAKTTFDRAFEANGANTPPTPEPSFSGAPEKFFAYSEHPIFAEDRLFETFHDSGSIVASFREISASIEEREQLLSLKRTSLAESIDAIVRPLSALFTELAAAYVPRIEGSNAFFESLWQHVCRILVDDLAYFERRGSIEATLQNHQELEMYWALETRGFFTTQVDPSVVANLRASLAPIMASIEEKARQGLDSREHLSVNQIPREITAYLNRYFEQQGINRAVRGTRREAASVSGFALELSVPNAGWWQSGYATLGHSNELCSYFHTDEGRDFYKAILYLSDVERAEFGATGYIPSTFAARRERLPWIVGRAICSIDRSLYPDLNEGDRLSSLRAFRQHFMMLPEYLRENSHWGFDAIDALPIAKTIAEREEKLLGKAGRCIVFDGSRLVHRGGLVKQGQRWALQIIFGVNKQNVAPLYSRLPALFKGGASE